tara:strand:+ start:529 stop:666 length:138 start_codon:yes stop_codon:yes gene_type:complete
MLSISTLETKNEKRTKNIDLFLFFLDIHEKIYKIFEKLENTSIIV